MLTLDVVDLEERVVMLEGLVADLLKVDSALLRRVKRLEKHIANITQMDVPKRDVVGDVDFRRVYNADEIKGMVQEVLDRVENRSLR